MESLNIQERVKKCNHFAKKERKSGKIPGVLYGSDINSFMFEVGEIELNNQIKRDGEHGLLNVEVDGSIIKALIKEVQREPLSHKVIHIDLEKVDGNEYIQTEIPLVLKGEGAVKSKGGIIQKEKISVKIQCKADNIPRSIDIDVSNLDIGGIVRIGDVELGEDFTFIEPENTVIVSITTNNSEFDEEDDDEEKEDAIL